MWSSKMNSPENIVHGVGILKRPQFSEPKHALLSIFAKTFLNTTTRVCLRQKCHSTLSIFHSFYFPRKKKVFLKKPVNADFELIFILAHKSFQQLVFFAFCLMFSFKYPVQRSESQQQYLFTFFKIKANKLRLLNKSPKLCEDKKVFTTLLPLM